MKVDESGAPWPYDAVEAEDEDAGVPTWKCPGGLCECHPTEGEAERAAHRILFFDAGARRMNGARCRVLENGELINKEHPYADGGGAVPVKIRASTRVLELEWAPAELPIGPGFPYLKRYYLDLGEGTEQGVHRRLHNLGFSVHSAIDENIRDFQRAYLQTPTGMVDHVKVELSSFHDDGALPPLPRSSDANAKTQLAFSKGPSQTINFAPGATSGGSVVGGVKAQGSATAVLMMKLRIRVRSRSGRLIDGARVNVDVGASSVEKITATDGFVTISLTQDEIDFLTSPPNEVVVRVRKLHHGPELGNGKKVIPSDINVSMRLAPPGFADAQPNVGPANPSAPGLAVDKQGTFLDLVLRDAGMNRAAISPNVTRRMTDDEVQNELIFHHVAGAITLAPASEVVFDHDPSTGEFGACTPSCTIKGPTADLWVGLKPATIGGVTWFQLSSFVNNGPKSGDVAPTQLFLRDKFVFTKKPLLSNLDQRQVVGLVRLSKELNRDFNIVAVYTQGIEGDTNRTDSHGYGLAVDFGGASTELPDTSQTVRNVKLGVDFVVMYHWGRVPMWDSALVAANPTNPAAWKRGAASVEDRIDFEKDLLGTKNKLHYRLDPAPFQDPIPPLAPPALTDVAPHFQFARGLFERVFDIAAREYTDESTILGPLPGVTELPTAIDAQHGHNTIHPDYSKPNSRGPDKKDPSKIVDGPDGRGAHVNHLHFQLGKTHYLMADGKTPKPRLK